MCLLLLLLLLAVLLAATELVIVVLLPCSCEIPPPSTLLSPFVMPPSGAD